jgi:glyoxylase-like metal-dependent hydrolase (beta-lactamase superfamily II)
MLIEALPGVFLAAANGRKGFGYSTLVVRPGGNVLVDPGRLGSLSESFGDMEAKGGISTVIVSDRHMGGGKADEAKRRFGAKIYASDIEYAAYAKRGMADAVLPFVDQRIEDDIRLIPTPGHTPGQFTALMEVEGARILFTSDFVWRAGGVWRPGNRSRKVMQASFERLRPLQFDWVFTWTDWDETEFGYRVEKPIGEVIDDMIAACDKP